MRIICDDGSYITNCIYCPDALFSPTGRICANTEDGREIKVNFPIPDWCPLPVYKNPNDYGETLF